MATIGTAYTLVDIAKGWDPNGSQARVVELLNQITYWLGKKNFDISALWYYF